MQGTLVTAQPINIVNLCVQVGQEGQGSLAQALGGRAGLFRRTAPFLRGLLPLLHIHRPWGCVVNYNRPEWDWNEDPTARMTVRHCLTHFSGQSEMALTISSLSAFVINKPV